MKVNGKQIIERCTCLAVRRAARAVGQRYDAALRAGSLTNGQFSLLAQLKLLPGPTVSELANRLVLDRTTLTRNLELLRERELIALAPGALDARTRVISLTDAGEWALARSFVHWRRAQDSLTVGLGAAGLDEILRGARKVAERLTASAVGKPSTRAKTATIGGDSTPGFLGSGELAVLRQRMCVATTVRRTSRAISMSFDEALRPVDMLCSQLHLLAAIDASPGMRLGAFVDKLTLDQTTLSRLMQRLQREDLACVAAKGPLRHGFLLTDAGKRVLVDAIPLWREAQRRTEAIEGSGERLHLLMGRLIDAPLD